MVYLAILKKLNPIIYMIIINYYYYGFGWRLDLGGGGVTFMREKAAFLYQKMVYLILAVSVNSELVLIFLLVKNALTRSFLFHSVSHLTSFLFISYNHNDSLK